MRKSLFIFTFFMSVISYGQNWNVFNKWYRYNYKFNNSQVISNVLFADTIKQTGPDTTYIMNNIVVVTGTVLTTDQPQFLQKKIIKLANGTVFLQTTNPLIIIPTCTLSQTWLFDAVNNYSATCVAITTETVFATLDSIKIILINNVDSIKLSKQFGIIQYPELYAQNQYYRLDGIERSNNYDSVPLFGTKVPNAWDFYNFKIGQGICTDYGYLYLTSPAVQNCTKSWAVVQSKTITPTGYIYLLSRKTETSNFSNACSPFSTNPFVNVIASYTGLSSTSVYENRMYPGMIGISGNFNFMVSMVKLGTNNQTIISKYYGPTTYTSNGPFNNNSYATSYSITNNEIVQANYIVGQGLASSAFHHFETHITYATGCGANIGVSENTFNSTSNLFYPNPVNSKLIIAIDGETQIKISDLQGKVLIEEHLRDKNFRNTSQLDNGLYFLEIQSDSFKSTQKLIIQH